MLKTITSDDLISDHKSVRLQVDDVDKAKAILAQAGVQILGEQMETMSLEDYYFGLLNAKSEEV